MNQYMRKSDDKMSPSSLLTLFVEGRVHNFNVYFSTSTSFVECWTGINF